MILSGVAFVSLFLAIILPAACKGGNRQIYVVCSGTYTTLARAEERAAAMQRAGGGGYVWSPGLHYVLSAAYVAENDCDEIVAGLGAGHSKLAVTIPEHYDDVARVTRKLAEIYYALDSGGSAEAGRDALLRFLDEERFPSRLSGERREAAEAVLSDLRRLGLDELSVNVKYFQLAFLCIFAA